MKRIQKISILGAGNIGFQIGQVAATYGYDVTIRDISESILQRSAQAIKDSLQKHFVEKGKMTAGDAEHIFSRIAFTNELKNAVVDADLVIESIPENVELKQQVLRELDDMCPPPTILTSNSSSLSVTEICTQVKRQDKVAGFHFSNPPSILNLVEIRVCPGTSTETVEALKEVGTQMHMEVMVVKDYPGGIARILNVMINEAAKLIEAGVCTPQDIDLVCKKAWGHRWGIMEVADMTLEVPYSCLCYLEKHFGHGYAPAPILKKMIDSGKTGRKSGQGFYNYEK